MDVEQESLDLIEPSQGVGDTEMSEDIAFNDEKLNTEDLQDEGDLLKLAFMKLIYKMTRL